MEILTRDPEVWKRTILILTYDENDGYYDHIPPFVAPRPEFSGTGAASPGIDASLEHDEHGVPIGLGYRVPMVIASPWSRGGKVCSQVFDHTSVLQFLEVFLSHKTGKSIQETNISSWRRAICGDLTSAFCPNNGERDQFPSAVDRDPFVKSIHRAKLLAAPSTYKLLSDDDIQEIRNNSLDSAHLPQQEPGDRPSLALPYSLQANGQVNRSHFVITFESLGLPLPAKAVGAPFSVYAPGKTYPDDVASYTDSPAPVEEMRRWSFAVSAGDKLTYSWPLPLFEGEYYHLRTYGPNGFYREYAGDAADPKIQIVSNESNGQLILHFTNEGTTAVEIVVTDLGYGAPPQKFAVPNGQSGELAMDLTASARWYDLSVAIASAPRFTRRFAGRVENGKESTSDPQIGRSRLS
jgi:phospholipase C